MFYLAPHRADVPALARAVSTLTLELQETRAGLTALGNVTRLDSLHHRLARRSMPFTRAASATSLWPALAFNWPGAGTAWRPR